MCYSFCMLAVDELPDDPKTLKEILFRELAAKDAAIEQIKREAAERIEAMELTHKAEMDAILRRFYGPRSERFDPTQLLLFGVAVAACRWTNQRRAEVRPKARHAPHQAAQAWPPPLPERLPRITIEHDLTRAEASAPAAAKRGTASAGESSEQLEYIPASFKVLKHVRHKYACKTCARLRTVRWQSATSRSPPRRPQPIEKGLPGPGLLAYVIVSKLGDHLPLYRLERIFARQGVDIARSTMCAWMLADG